MNLIDIGKLPIQGDNPAGYDVRAEDIYERLSTEINKRVTLTAGGVVDWALVVRLSQDILQNHSKDILVCSYLCIGLLNTSGLKGFAAGLHIFTDLLDNYWANLFPPRINGRINAIDWWINTVNEQLRKISAESWLEAEIEKLNQDFDALIKFFDEHEIERFSDIKVIQAACRGLVSAAKEVQTPTAETTSSPKTDENKAPEDNNQTSQSANAQSGSGSFTVEAVNLPDNINLGDIGRSLNPVFSALGKISDVINENQPTSYMLFRINRFCAWLNLSSIPTSDKDGKTFVPAPEEYIINYAKELYSGKKWPELLKFAEARVVQFCFWLDLSYYVYTALNNLNETGSATELAYETLILTKRLNGIEKLLFSNGMPFAEAETIEWIAGLGGSSGGEGGGNKLIGDDELWTSEVEEAKQLVDKGDLPLALSKLHYRIQSALSKRDQFLRILYFCQFVISAKHVNLAKPYIYELLDSCNKYQLEIWEPALVSEAYQLILSVARQKKVKFEDQEINDVLNRLTVIDPSGALKFHAK